MESDELKRLFGQRLQSLRRSKGMTQEQLADASDKSVDTISNIERGFSNTRIETAYAIASALGVNLAELYEFGLPNVGDKAKRVAVQRLVQLVEGENPETIESLIPVILAALRLRKGS